MSATERQMAADAVALSKEHADRADAAEARWQALKDDLTQRIEHDLAVMRDTSNVGTAAVHGGLASANQSTLAKMRELEDEQR